MATEKTKFETVDQYISSLSKEEQDVLRQIRKTVQKAAPDAEEVISYSIPAYKQNGYVIYISGGYKAHYNLSFPPPFTVFEKFQKELSSYKTSKSSVQLPKDQPIPYDLITEMVKFRVKELARLKKK